MRRTASVYDENGNYITQGLQPSAVCDEAIITAKSIAADREKEVILEDDDGYWMVSPDGGVRATTAKEIGFDEEEFEETE